MISFSDFSLRLSVHGIPLVTTTGLELVMWPISANQLPTGKYYWVAIGHVADFSQSVEGKMNYPVSAESE